MIAVARATRGAHAEGNKRALTNPLAFSASGESKRRHSYVATEPGRRSPGSFYALMLLSFQ